MPESERMLGGSKRIGKGVSASVLSYRDRQRSRKSGLGLPTAIYNDLIECGVNEG
jgi:hypothetical protein